MFFIPPLRNLLLLNLRLNPFGSGMFFIQRLSRFFAFLRSLNPFGSGMFFIQTCRIGKVGMMLVLIPLDQGCFLFEGNCYEKRN